MDLSSLDTTLPPALADAERDMGDKFRAAAMSITQLYKSSLGCTKQAYQAGYSAALADVLSKVQSDIGSGEDAAAALARLMDWSEARQAAIRTFAEDDEQPQAPRPQTAAQAMAQRQGGPQRPASAPVLDAQTRARANNARDGPGPSSLRNDAMDADEPTPTAARRSAAGPAPASASTILERSVSDMTPVSAPVPSSSPLPSPSHARPTISRNRGSASKGGPLAVPTSTFNFSIPSTYSIPAIELPPAGSGPAQTGPIGSKRPIIDADMNEGPSTPRQGRPNKRRQLNSGAGQQEDEKESQRSNGRKPNRRGGQSGPGGPTPL